ncbi:nadh:flavin oxidoreductase nadh oxidase [Moniliophthora roreri MCA 2997]|uniref:Nadh:flavin oxidoreductase nadh oxidase n=2 Tax=Moniliophthora roreri TaxID=221103 RepID=V2WDS7_MONRO|nr:nadh:flavin oxidoreductase nadh oxidase [Moniliophthora roreri MCA 2997]KAI3621067.1 flavin oxidoreductase nadh oxidase [Moniliophthora roreri]
MSSPILFQPVKVGNVDLKHRVVMAPCTRVRCTKFHDLQPHMKEYYAQRASTPGTLIISEGTFPSAASGGNPNYPGIWGEEHIKAWKEITDVIHAKGSFIFMQLMARGRVAETAHLKAINPSFEVVSSSNIGLSNRPSTVPKPRSLTLDEINGYIELYATAAANAINKAGCDGVELHAANGYMIDQFTQDVCNIRTDEYGGSIENRCRFALEIVKKVGERVGLGRVGVRISPWSQFQEMGMRDPKPTFTYLVSKLKELYPSLAYLHVIEPRIKGNITIDELAYPDASNDFIRDIWAPLPLVSAGAYTRNQAIERAEKSSGTELIAFGRYFISNPDLPLRLKSDIPLNPYDRSTFYVHGDTSARGYTDYPFATNVPRSI